MQAKVLNASASASRDSSSVTTTTTTATTATITTTTSAVVEGLSPSLLKVERKAIQKFTTDSGYDKLCKACPTRLQPRVDVLVEMILGLSDDDRNELMGKVSKRLEHGEISNISCAQDVYRFQTSKAFASAETTTEEEDSKSKTSESMKLPSRSLSEASNPPKGPHDNKKLISKMDKTKRKFDYSKQGIAKSNRLLEATTALLSTATNSALAYNSSKSQDETMFNEEPFDNNYYHEIDELRSMTRQELKMQRLKYQAQRAKFEQKLAKYRMKMFSYGTSQTLVGKQATDAVAS